MFTTRQEQILEDAFELLSIAILHGYFDDNKRYQMEELYELNDLLHKTEQIIENGHPN